MARKKFIGANWKMHEPPVGACTPDSPYRSVDGVDVYVFPSFLDLHTTQEHGLKSGAQWGHAVDRGAYTGDISMKMLARQKVLAVLCGHSERRQYHHETDAQVAKQVAAAAAYGMMPILCVGETSLEREKGETEIVLTRQINAVKEVSGMIIAYEPVWAIGTGATPTPTEVEHTHAFIRSLMKDKDIRIIYGGSVQATNAQSFFSQLNVDGGLIGGASLKPEEFRKIVEIAQSL